MRYFNFDGSLYTEDTPIIGPQNRGLRYGDGLFETLKNKNGVIILANEHLQRLWTGLTKLKMNLPKLFTKEYLLKQVELTLKKNNLENARLRINVFRGNGGLYDQENDNPHFIIECWPLTTDTSILNSNGLQLSIFTQALKSIDNFSNIKHNNFLVYTMGALEAKAKKCNDAIILNAERNVCETTIANIFIVRNEQVFTPPLSQGCIAGVTRAEIISSLQPHGINIVENIISIKDLEKADEIFLSNSMYNIRWVAGIGKHKYTNVYTQKLFHLLQKTKPTVFC